MNLVTNTPLFLFSHWLFVWIYGTFTGVMISISLTNLWFVSEYNSVAHKDENTERKMKIFFGIRGQKIWKLINKNVEK